MKTEIGEAWQHQIADGEQLRVSFLIRVADMILRPDVLIIARCKHHMLADCDIPDIRNQFVHIRLVRFIVTFPVLYIQSEHRPRIGRNVLYLRDDLHTVNACLRSPAHLIGSIVWPHVPHVEESSHIVNIKGELCIVVSVRILGVNIGDHTVELLMQIGVVVRGEILGRAVGIELCHDGLIVIAILADLRQAVTLTVFEDVACADGGGTDDDHTVSDNETQAEVLV